LNRERAPPCVAFGWGGGDAALTALIINTATGYVTHAPRLGASTGEYVRPPRSAAPVVEETLKGLVLIGLLWRRRAESTARPTVSYAAMVGLGFAMIENGRLLHQRPRQPGARGIALLATPSSCAASVPAAAPIFTSMTGLASPTRRAAGAAGSGPVALGLLAAD